ncbi:MAG: ACP phosphodiesterase [Halopseudomonas sp.]
MNYLAHLLFAESTPESLMANLMGDFVKGRVAVDWQPSLRDGVLLHRQIDAFTDSHPLFLQSSARLSPQRRRFAGIIIDICYDHFLSRHWDAFHEQSRQQFIAQSYQFLQQYQGYMPDRMQRPLRLMIEQDWLSAYADADQIVLVLDRVAHRLSRPQRMLGSGEEFLHHYQAFEQDFLAFFPQLIKFVESRTS